MLFTTDKQTLDDLNIFGQHGSDSIYAIFNRTSTRGGAAVLAEMFNYPLSDEIAINRRLGTIQYFAGTAAAFPFSAADLDAIEPYLDNTDERTKLAAQDHSVTKKISNLIAVDADTSAIYRGLQTMADLLKNLYDFAAGLQLEDGHCYETERSAMLSLLAEPAFRPILDGAAKSKLSNAVMMEYDVLFRFRHREVILKLLRFIHHMDVYFTIAKVAKERGFIFPQALPKDRHTVMLEGLYHPQVKNAVPNSIQISPGGNVIFLTGANMAGKSTFMKSLSVALYLAHMGFPVAAQKMEFSVLDGIYTTINLPDNLGMGASHFYAEVLRVKKMAQELSQGKNLFILFDELFRGTNVKDACEATIACTAGFARKRNSIFVVSTHIIEAGEVLRERCDNINFVYLPTRMEGSQPVYTYTLEEGITADRHGMIIINNEGILEILKAGIAHKTKTA